MIDSKKIGIMIPCYNVEQDINYVLESFSVECLEKIDQIIAIDNCSTDNTLKVLKAFKTSKFPAASKLVICKNHENYGLGGSQKIAYRYFINQGFTHFLIIHGDNQGNGREIVENFLNALQLNPSVDVIIASRFLVKDHTKNYNLLRKIGNYVFNILTFILTGYRMSDSGAGTLFYRTAMLANFPFEELTNSFQFNPQLNILLYAAGVSRMEVPLVWKDASGDSNIKAWNYCLTLLKILLHYRIAKLLRKKGGLLFHTSISEFKPQYELI